MRRSGKWMILADDRILEFLVEEGPKPPSAIAEDNRIPWGTQHVNNRCIKLTSSGLIDNLGRGVYTITDEGEAYLAGELDASDLEPDEE